MKILIAYDGSNCSKTAIDDLGKAGLPENGEFLVMSVVEIWLPPENLRGEWKAENTSDYLMEISRKQDKRRKKVLAETEVSVNRAAARLRQMFPGWNVMTQAEYGSPAWEILTKADDFKADLIVTGSHGRAAVGRLFLGSISNKILTEADCSVRVGRGKMEVDSSPERVVIGYDGSPGALAAVEAAAVRNWREASEFHLVIVTDQVPLTAVESLITPIAEWIKEDIRDEFLWAEKVAEKPLKILREANYCAELRVHAGNPKDVLVEEAEKWGADAIFVGANRFGSRLERFLLGTTSAAVAARAHCSVEVVRRKT